MAFEAKRNMDLREASCNPFTFNLIVMAHHFRSVRESMAFEFFCLAKMNYAAEKSNICQIFSGISPYFWKSSVYVKIQAFFSRI